jgi:hypothetical protein
VKIYFVVSLRANLKWSSHRHTNNLMKEKKERKRKKVSFLKKNYILVIHSQYKYIQRWLNQETSAYNLAHQYVACISYVRSGVKVGTEAFGYPFVGSLLTMTFAPHHHHQVKQRACLATLYIYVFYVYTYTYIYLKKRQDLYFFFWGGEKRAFCW